MAWSSSRRGWTNAMCGLNSLLLWVFEVVGNNNPIRLRIRHLAHGDIMVDSLNKPTMLRIRIKASKTYPFRVGVDFFIVFAAEKQQQQQDEELGMPPSRCWAGGKATPTSSTLRHQKSSWQWHRSSWYKAWKGHQGAIPLISRPP